MNIIAFSWTTASLFAPPELAKTCTRRRWNDRYAAKFHAGQLVQAYDKNPRNGGRCVAIIRLARDPYRENTLYMPASDYIAEGFAYLAAHPELMRAVPKDSPVSDVSPEGFERWRRSAVDLWVCRFELIERVG